MLIVIKKGQLQRREHQWEMLEEPEYVSYTQDCSECSNKVIIKNMEFKKHIHEEYKCKPYYIENVDYYRAAIKDKVDTSVCKECK